MLQGRPKQLVAQPPSAVAPPKVKNAGKVWAKRSDEQFVVSSGCELQAPWFVLGLCRATAEGGVPQSLKLLPLSK
jgi:hypothetical protein